MPKERADRTQPESPDASSEAVDEHLSWVPLPLARQILRTTHDLPQDRHFERARAAIACWELFATMVVLLAPAGAISPHAFSGGSIGDWMAGARSRLDVERRPRLGTRPKQEALRSWMNEVLARRAAGALADATAEILDRLPELRNKHTGAHGPPSRVLAEPAAARLLLDALAELLDEERLLRKDTELVWVAETFTNGTGQSRVRGQRLRGQAVRHVDREAPSDLVPGRVYVASDGWRPVHPWLLIDQRKDPPAALVFSQAKARGGDTTGAVYLAAIDGDRVELDAATPLGREALLAIGSLSNASSAAHTAPRDPLHAPRFAPRAAVGVAGLSLLMLMFAGFGWRLDRDAIRAIPSSDWRLAWSASSNEWRDKCFEYGVDPRSDAARVACDRWRDAAKAQEVPRALREVARLARRRDDRASVVATLADPRLGAYDDSVDELAKWACEAHVPVKPPGFVGYRVVRASVERPTAVLSGAPQAGAKLDDLVGKSALRAPICAAVGSISRGEVEPAEWIVVVLDSADASATPTQVPLTSVAAPTDPQALERCRTRIAQGRAGRALRECTEATLAAPSSDRHAALLELAGLLRQVDRADAQLDWLATASHYEPAAATRARIERACSDFTEGKLPPLVSTERFRLVRWQWAERQGNLRPSPRNDPGEKHEALGRGTCVAVDQSRKSGPWLPVRAAWEGAVVAGWMHEAVLSP